jgi:hypothetical protein
VSSRSVNWEMVSSGIALQSSPLRLATSNGTHSIGSLVSLGRAEKRSEILS